jgi:Dolichyl-phosphate-mannose-protein mannosyltransferase
MAGQAAMISARARRLIVQAIPLVAILVLGLELRLTFYQGVIYTDDLVYSHLARRMAEGTSPFAEPLPDLYGAVRIGLYAPVALAYTIFGTSDATTLAWPFACSILAILGAYAIGRLVHNETSGLLAAFLLAILPTNVAAGTALLGDGPIATLSIATVFFLLVSSRTQGWQSAVAMVGSLVCFVVGILNKPAILLLLPFLVFYVVVWVKRSFLTIAGSVLAVAVGIAGYALYFGLGAREDPPGFTMTMKRIAMTATDLWQQLVVGRPEFAWIAPLWIVAAVALLAWRRGEAKVVLLWLGLTFLYGELGTRTLTMYTPIVWYDVDIPARHFLFIAAPAMILTGIFLAQGLKAGTARWVIVLAAVVTGLSAWAGSRGAANMTWGVTGEAPADLPFATISGLATILVVFGGIASPALITAEAAVVRVIGTAALVVAIGLASLNHSYRAANEFKGPWVETFPEALRFLDSQPPLPIMVQNEMFGLRLDYLSGFRLGFHSTLRPFVQNPRIQIAPADATTLTDAYILVDEYYLRIALWGDGPPYLRSPPARWVKIADFGKYPGNHLKIYRVSYHMAADALAAARAAVARSSTPSTLHSLLDAAAGAGAYCEAVRVWHDVRATAPQEVDSFNPVPILTECYKANPSVAGPNLFQNGDFSQGLASWAKHPDSDATIQVERDPDGVPVWHANYRGGNWSVIYQEQVLRPDTVYVYGADVKTSAPVVSLYWQTEVGRFFELTNTYPAWTHLLYVFITPHWNGQPMRTSFNPVLMKGPGDAWIKGLRLSEFRAPRVQ